MEFTDLAWSRVTEESIAEMRLAVILGAMPTGRLQRALGMLANKKKTEVTTVASCMGLDESENDQWIAPVQKMTVENGENVHLVSVQDSLRKSLELIRRLTELHSFKKEHLEAHVHELLLRRNTVWTCLWSRLFRPLDRLVAKAVVVGIEESPNKHYAAGIRYDHLLHKILILIKDHEYREVMISILRDEIVAGKDLCPTGKFTRMVNALNGFIEGVAVTISVNEDIANSMVAIQRRCAKAYGSETSEYLERAITEAQKVLVVFKLPPGECDMWLEYL
jgi:hypothetical protein